MISVLNRGGFGVFCAGQGSVATNSSIFQPLYDPSGTHINATEASVDMPLDFDFRVIRVRANVVTNTKDGSTTIAFRDDAVSIGTLTILASATGEFDSGALTTLVASGSKCNFNRNTSTSTAGSIQWIGYCQYEVL